MEEKEEKEKEKKEKEKEGRERKEQEKKKEEKKKEEKKKEEKKKEEKKAEKNRMIRLKGRKCDMGEASMKYSLIRDGVEDRIRGELENEPPLIMICPFGPMDWDSRNGQNPYLI